MTWLLPSIHWLLVLAGRHIHNVLGSLAGLRVLMHHHRGAAARTRVAAMRLRGWHMRIGMSWAWRIHLHLRREWSLGNAHVRPSRRLLDHDRRCHGTLRIDEWRSALVLSHVGGLRCALIDEKLRHRLLAICKLCMRCHR